MIERKGINLNKNLSENKSKDHTDRKSFISSVTNSKQKTAAETASSILEELGVKKTATKKINKNSLLDASRKNKKIINQNNQLDEIRISILNDLKKEKFNTTVRHSPKNENKKIEVYS